MAVGSMAGRLAEQTRTVSAWTSMRIPRTTDSIQLQDLQAHAGGGPQSVAMLRYVDSVNGNPYFKVEVGYMER